jgi:hypothetical protein
MTRADFRFGIGHEYFGSAASRQQLSGVNRHAWRVHAMPAHDPERTFGR